MPCLASQKRRNWVHCTAPSLLIPVFGPASAVQFFHIARKTKMFRGFSISSMIYLPRLFFVSFRMLSTSGLQSIQYFFLDLITEHCSHKGHSASLSLFELLSLLAALSASSVAVGPACLPRFFGLGITGGGVRHRLGAPVRYRQRKCRGRPRTATKPKRNHILSFVMSSAAPRARPQSRAPLPWARRLEGEASCPGRVGGVAGGGCASKSLDFAFG